MNMLCHLNGDRIDELGRSYFLVGNLIHFKPSSFLCRPTIPFPPMALSKVFGFSALNEFKINVFAIISKANV